MTAVDGPDLDRAVAALRRARRVLAITGAGISAESGLPTYRGVGGLYNDAATDDGVPVEVALSGPMFRERPELCWKHLRAIELACRGATPNAAHSVLAEMERALPTVWVLTQNVDGLHRRAGTEKLIDIHGDVHDIVCTRCPRRDRVEDYAGLAPLPKCPDCGAPLRPEVVLFGELLPEAKVARMHQILEEGFDLVFSIGTTSVFPYIAGPVVAAARARVPTVEINPGDTAVSPVVDSRLRTGAAAALTAIWQRYCARG